MIVVPALPEGEDGNPEAVCRRIAGEESLRAPHVSCGVYEPCGMETDDDTEKDTPKKEGQPADCKKRRTQQGQWDPVPFADPDVELVLAKIRDKRQVLACGGVMHRLAR